MVTAYDAVNKRIIKEGRWDLQSQRSISCVQQEFSPPVNANYSNGLLVQAHLEDDNMAADTSDENVTIGWGITLQGSKISQIYSLN